MEFEPHGRMLKASEVCNLTGLSYGQTRSLLLRYGVQVGAQYSISVEKLKGLIIDGTVARIAQRHGGRPAKKEGEHA